MSNCPEKLDDIAEIEEVLERVSSAVLLIKMLALVDAYGENDDEEFKYALKEYLDAVANFTLGVSAKSLPLPL